jgi:choline dehydrogenase-like flavoprotein
MMIDARTVADAASIEADLCVVGAGAAGITLARAFANAPFRTVVLESGGMELESDTQRLNEGESVGLDYFPLVGARLRYFGGTTNHWGGTCRPFDAPDFAGMPGVANTTWPISLADVEPHYDEAAAIVQLSDSGWTTEEWAERSRFEPLPIHPATFETRVAKIVDVNQRSFNRLYADAVEAAPSVTTYLHANVVEIALTDDLASVSELVVATPDRRFTVRAQRYVLAAGGIENARILLASNRQQPDGVGNGNGLVGRYFIEHPRFIGGVIEGFDPRMSASFYQPHQVDGTRILGYLALARAAREAEELVDVQMRLDAILSGPHERAQRSQDVAALRSLLDRARGQGSGGDMWEEASRAVDDLTSIRRILVPGAGVPIPQPELMRILADASPAELDALVPEFFGDIAVFGYGSLTGGAPVETIELSTRLDPVPNPDSRVTLGSERDAFGMPQVQLDWQLTERDRQSAERALEILGQELGRTGMGRLQVRLPPGDGWPDDLEGGYHHMGTTRMSADEHTGVVDADCRVHGVSNLYVAGSSVFTTGGSATPTMTLIALALRLADHLRESFA